MSIDINQAILDLVGRKDRGEISPATFELMLTKLLKGDN